MYTNWNEVTIEGFEWYPVNTVIEHLHALRRYIIRTPSAFSASYLPKLVGDDLAETETTLGATEYQLPASEKERFPEDKKFLCEAIGHWNLLKDELELTASVLVNTNRLERCYPHFKTLGDAELHCLQLIQRLLSIIEAKKEVLSRREFEERYGLQWKERVE
ncbi:hypothetical protein A0J61_04914 [Choanephora cucurbitarum]|uniref:Uncharacterized protein n=1 Tax=Choanephora cucurbitarum TaxID=101091 RepID=A0A1C7NI80_9FUNG|nr:hypothetical protein A0J61_04914 [Choanephora cucurbitarum]